MADKLKIAFDLDGVVYDLITQLNTFMEKHGHKLVNPNVYAMGKRYGITEELGLQMLDKWGETRPFLTMPLIDVAKKEMMALKDHELYIITYRDWTQTGKEDTLARIVSDKLPVKKENVIFSKEKGDIAKKLGIQLFYEDSIDNARLIIYESDSLVALIDTPYNQGELERLLRVTW